MNQIQLRAWLYFRLHPLRWLHYKSCRFHWITRVGTISCVHCIRIFIFCIRSPKRSICTHFKGASVRIWPILYYVHKSDAVWRMGSLWPYLIELLVLCIGGVNPQLPENRPVGSHKSPSTLAGLITITLCLTYGTSPCSWVLLLLFFALGSIDPEG